MSFSSMHQLFLQHYIDQKTCCFFCLQDSRKYNKAKDISNGNDFSLDHMFRFLGGSSYSMKDRAVTVATCESCSKLASEFTELYHLMEVTRLKLIWCIKRMHDVMSKTKSKDESKPMGRESDGGCPETTLKMRSEAMGLMKTMTPSPLVSLQSIQTTSQEDEETTATVKVEVQMAMDTDTLDDYSPPSSPSRVQCELDDQEDFERDIKRRKLNMGSSLANKKPYDLLFNGQCPYCKGRFPNNSVLHCHMFHYHCHHFFPNHKLESVTVEQFRKILAELLFKDLIKGKTSCIYCDKKFPAPKTGRNVSQVKKKHYVDHHYHELEKKLLEIQEDPNLSERLAEASISNPNGKFCECGVYLPSILCQINHQKTYCTLDKKKVNFDSLMPVAVASSSEDKTGEKSECLPPPVEAERLNQVKGEPTKLKSFPCAFCRGKLCEKYALKSHMIQYHCETFFPNHKLDSITDLEFQKILVDLLFKDAFEGDKCPFCNNVQKNTRLYKAHMVSFHFEELEKKLKEIQNDPNLPTTLALANPTGRVCELCGMYLENVNSQVTHDKLHCTKVKNPKPITKTPRRRPEDLMTKFDSIPSDPKKISCKLCGNVMHRRNANKHWNFFCVHGKRVKKETRKSKRSKYSRSCPYCRYQCNSNEHVNIVLKHLVRFHPEHFFLQERQKEFSMVPLYVFQRVLVDIIFPECFQKVGPSISCRLCELNFLRYYESKTHLVQHHKKELMERFQVVVKDPNLEERLKDNPDGMSCPCGVYLPNGGKSGSKQRHYHEKNQCKLQSEGTPSEPISQQEIMNGQI